MGGEFLFFFFFFFIHIVYDINPRRDDIGNGGHKTTITITAYLLNYSYLVGNLYKKQWSRTTHLNLSDSFTLFIK